MTPKPCHALLAAALAIAACAGPAAPANLPTGVLTVGMITSLIGVDHSLAIDAGLGAQQAVNEVNSGGGIAGHRVQLRTEDDSGQADLVAAAYSRLAAHRPLGIIGPLFAAGDLSLAQLTASAKLPVISLSGADQVVMNGSSVRPNVFLGVPAASRSAERMLAYLHASKLDKVAVAHPAGDPFSDQGLTTLKGQAGRFAASVVDDESFEPATTDFGPLMKRVRASGAKVLLAWGSGAGTPLLTRAWKSSGLAIPILLSVASSTTSFLKAAGEDGQGALVEATASVLAGSPSAAPKQVAAMADAFQRSTHYYPSQAAFDGYAAARLLLAAVASAGSADPKAIDSALAKLSLPTASGTFTFSARDHLGLPSGWLQIAAVKDGHLAPAA